jgi:hypothetical protein
MFDPKVGRFLSTDPLVSHPGFSQSWNPYSYVLNNPLRLVDPTGFGDVPANISMVGEDNVTFATLPTPTIGVTDPGLKQSLQLQNVIPREPAIAVAATGDADLPAGDPGPGAPFANDMLAAGLGVAPQLSPPGGPKWFPGMGGPPRTVPGPSGGLPVEAPPLPEGLPAELPGVGPGAGAIVGEILAGVGVVLYTGATVMTDGPIPVEDVVPSLRPDRPLGSTVHPFNGVPKGIHPALFDVLTDLQAARAGDSAAASRNAARNTHTLTGNLRGWTSMDILGREFNLRIIYKFAPDGISWDVVDTHAR